MMHTSFSFPWLVTAALLSLPGTATLSLDIGAEQAAKGRFRSGPIGAEAEIEEEHRLSMGYATPHTDWAQPYAQGTTEVLFFTAMSRRDTYAREIIELMQRFDLAAQAVYYATGFDDPPNIWVGGKLGEARMLRLLEKPRAVYLVQHLTLEQFPPEARARLVSALKAGAGRVLMGGDDSGLLKAEGQPQSPPESLSSLPQCEVYGLGMGRVARLPARPVLGYQPGWEVEYDHWQERLGRALLWAANKPPKYRLQVSVEPASISWGDLPSKAVQVSWEGRAEGPFRLEVRLRRADGMHLNLGTRGVSGPRGQEKFELPRLRADHYYLEVWAKVAKEVETWAVQPFEVNTSRSVALSINPQWGETGDRIRGTVDLKGTELPGEMIHVEVLDTAGRIIARQPPEAATKDRASFEVVLESWFPMLIRVEAIVTSDGREVRTASQLCRVTHRRHDSYNTVIWGCPYGTLAPHFQRRMMDLGVTCVLEVGRAQLEQAAFDAPWVPTAGDGLDVAPQGLDANGVRVGGDWNDPERQKLRRKALMELRRDDRQHGVFVYNLGDEILTFGSSLGAHDTEAYRCYLKETYGTIAALNESWNTTHHDFSEVGPELTPAGFQRGLRDKFDNISKLNDAWKSNHEDFQRIPLPTSPSEPGWMVALEARNNEISALEGKNYARWYDRRAFQAHNFVEQARRLQQDFRTLDPQARTGFEGQFTFESTFGHGRVEDLDLIVRTMDFWVTYSGTKDEVIRSIAPRGLIRSSWIGYSKTPGEEQRRFWKTILNGANSTWWWECQGTGNWHGFLAPDFSPYEHNREFLDDLRMAQEGLVEELNHSEILDDQIAILYSMPSNLGRNLEKGPTFGASDRRIYDDLSWIQLIRDLGLQFRYVTDRMLRQGEFEKGRFKVLILPRVEALGPKETEVIREFAQAGGMVIADLRPGLYDGHCKPLERGALDDLFGVRREGNREAVISPFRIDGAVAGQGVTLSWDEDNAREAFQRDGLYDVDKQFGPRIDPAILLAGGKAQGHAAGSPVCITHDVGKGQTLLLNFSMISSFPTRYFGSSIGGPWNSENALESPREWLEFAGTLFRAAGVAPAVGVADVVGGPVGNLEVFRWKKGESQMLALYRGYGTFEPVRVKMAKEMYVHDLMEGRSLGMVSGFTTALLPNRARFFVLSPAPELQIQLSLDRGQLTAGQRVSVRLSVPHSEGEHALRVRILNPRGADAFRLAKKVWVVGQKPIEVVIATAFNDAPGAYTVKATGIAGNMASEVFELTAPPPNK